MRSKEVEGCRLYNGTPFCNVALVAQVRIKLKHMEIEIRRREQTGTGSSARNESETLAKYEIMDGAPVRGENIPIRSDSDAALDKGCLAVAVLQSWHAGCCKKGALLGKDCTGCLSRPACPLVVKAFYGQKGLLGHPQNPVRVYCLSCREKCR